MIDDHGPGVVTGKDAVRNSTLEMSSGSGGASPRDPREDVDAVAYAELFPRYMQYWDDVQWALSGSDLPVRTDEDRGGFSDRLAKAIRTDKSFQNAFGRIVSARRQAVEFYVRKILRNGQVTS